MESIGPDYSAKENFYYSGIEKNLVDMILSSKNKVPEQLKVGFNIDGLPISKSSSIAFWPILCDINNIETDGPLVVAIYVGKTKPNINEYLLKFSDELCDLLKSGINLNGTKYQIIVTNFICDAPAKAYIKQIKSHGGYFACDKCTTKGTYVNHSMSYPDIHCQIRTDGSFREQSQLQHHIGVSPLLKTNIDMINAFPVDYMHVILLGVVRRLLNMWLHKVPHKLSVNQKKVMNENLLLIRKYTPIEFNRKPRSLNEMERWKASELRIFILYTGPIVLKDVLPKLKYKHFLLLSCATRILCTQDFILDEEFLEFAQKLMLNFIKHYPKIYKNTNVVYNIHMLQHIVQDVKNVGVLDSFSAFKYENALGKIKNNLRSGNLPLQQICNRIEEKALAKSSVKPGIDVLHVADNIKLKSGLVKPNNLKNSAVLLLDGSVGFVDGYTACNEIAVIRKFSASQDIFKYPCDSQLLNVHSVNIKTKPRKVKVMKSEIKFKCFVMKIKSNFYFFPMIDKH